MSVRVAPLPPTSMLVLILSLAFVTQHPKQPPKPAAEDDDYVRFVPWMAEVRRLAPRYGYKIEEGDEAWEEWFWLYYFLEGYSPKRALSATRAYDRKHKKNSMSHQFTTTAGGLPFM